MSDTVLVTGGAGYIGACVCQELLAGGHRVRVLDALVHGQARVVGELERAGVAFDRGDLCDADARRRALAGATAVVHLAAVVGDPACARAPALAHAVNVEGTRALIDDAEAAGVGHLVFASTCSNYGRMEDPSVPIEETGELRPVSLYAEQKVGIERLLLAGRALRATCLRLATVYGVAPRMRFDLTVNEFTRDLWAGRGLEVFGEQFWRPYVHVRDVARAVRAVLDAPAARVDGEVFNVGCSRENYRKLDLVRLLGERLDTAGVSYVRREEDPRDYRVSFEKIRRELDFQVRTTVPAGIEEIVWALADGTIADPFDAAHSNLASAGAPASHHAPASHGTPASHGAPASHGTPASHGAPASHGTPASRGAPALHGAPASQGIHAPHGIHASQGIHAPHGNTA
jgi:nucleoside-diphosphate-sugar epimerase